MPDPIPAPPLIPPTKPRKEFLLWGVLLIFSLGFLMYFFNQSLPRTQVIDTNKPNRLSVSPMKQACEKKRYTVSEALLSPARVCHLQINSDDELLQVHRIGVSFINLESIYYNAINATISAEIATMPHLTSLNFHHTTNTSLPPEIGTLKNLTILHMSKTDIEHMPSEIGQLQNLTTLIVQLNTKPVVLPSEIAALSKLNVLTLRGNPSVFLPDLTHNSQLEYLNLSKNNLTSIPQGFEQLKQLKSINLTGNAIPVDAIERLKQALPQANIVY